MMGIKFAAPAVALAGVLALAACGDGGGEGGGATATASHKDKIMGSWDQDGGDCSGLTTVTFTETEVVMKAWGKNVSDTIDSWEEIEGIVVVAAQLPELGITSEDKLPLKVTDEDKLEMHASFTGAGRSTPPEFSLVRCVMK